MNFKSLNKKTKKKEKKRFLKEPIVFFYCIHSEKKIKIHHSRECGFKNNHHCGHLVGTYTIYTEN